MTGEQNALGQSGGVLARKLARARGISLDAAPDFGLGDAGFDAALGTGMGDDALPDFAPQASTAADPFLRAWRMALARAARDQMQMAVSFSNLTLRDVSLTEVLETPMTRAMILMLQGRGDGMGLLIFSGQMLAAMIEMLTLTRLSPVVPDNDDLRKPTRTDAALVVEFVDAALSNFEQTLGQTGGDNWAAGYRYAAFIDDPRPLHLMLEEGDYHLLNCDLALEDGARTGQITLALPQMAQTLALPDFSNFGLDANQSEPITPQPDDFTAEFAQHVQELAVELDATLTSISLPLDRILRLQQGEVLVLPMANLDQIQLVGVNGIRAAAAKLGQNRGLRALRLTDAALASPKTALDEIPQDAAPAPPPQQPEISIGFDMPAADHSAAEVPDFGADFPAFAAAL